MVRVTSGKRPHLARLARTQLSACFIKKKDAFQRLHLEWQRKLYDLRKKYADELTELYPIVQSLEDDPQIQKILKMN